jgi:hypothetical protein
VTFADVAERLRGTRVTPSLFRLLRVSGHGTFFSDADAQEGAKPVLCSRIVSGASASARILTSSESHSRSTGSNHEIHWRGASRLRVSREGSRAARMIGARSCSYTPFALRPRPGAKVIDFIGRDRPPQARRGNRAGRRGGTSYARSVDRPLADLVFGKGAPSRRVSARWSIQMTMRVRPR